MPRALQHHRQHPFRTTVVYNERVSQQLLAAVPFTFGSVGSGHGRSTSRRTTSTTRSAPTSSRAPVPQHGRSCACSTRTCDTFYFAGGFDGAFDLFDRSFSWDVNYIYTDNERNDLHRRPVRPEPPARAASARRSVTRRARRVAAPPAAVIAGCVPINMFGGPAGFTREMAELRLVRRAGHVLQQAVPTTPPTSPATCSSCRPARWRSPPATSTAASRASTSRTRSPPRARRPATSACRPAVASRSTSSTPSSTCRS